MFQININGLEGCDGITLLQAIVLLCKGLTISISP